MKNVIKRHLQQSEQMEDRISQLEDKNFGITQLEENKGKKNEKW